MKSLLLTSGESSNMKHRRFSLLQRIILEELGKAKDKTMNPSSLSYVVAERYAPETFWKLKNVKEPLAYALASNLHRKKELIGNKFSATFSRSLRNLEKKELIQLVKGQFEGKVENDIYAYYRIKTTQPRVTLVVHHQSPYFGRQAPDVDRLIDIVNEVKFNIPRDVNNKNKFMDRTHLAVTK